MNWMCAGCVLAVCVVDGWMCLWIDGWMDGCVRELVSCPMWSILCLLLADGICGISWNLEYWWIDGYCCCGFGSGIGSWNGARPDLSASENGLRCQIAAPLWLALRAEPGSWQVSAKDNGAEPCRLSAKARPTQEHCWASAWPERLSAEGQRHFTLRWGSPRQFGAEVPATSAWGKSVLGRHVGRAQRRCGWHWLISISFTSSLFINACTICFVCNMVNITDLGRIF